MELWGAQSAGEVNTESLHVGIDSVDPSPKTEKVQNMAQVTPEYVGSAGCQVPVSASGGRLHA